MNLNSVKCHIAGLAVLVAAAASAAVPARFCEYIESSTSGSTATYVDTGLKPHYINGKFFVDMELVDSTLPSNLRYLFGARRQTAIDNQTLVVCLDGANGKFRLDTLYKKKADELSLKRFSKDVMIGEDPSGIISCAFEAKNKVMARDIVRYMVQMSNERYLTLQKERLQYSVEYLKTQERELMDSVRAISDELVAFYRDNNLVDLEAQTELTVKALAGYETQINNYKLSEQVQGRDNADASEMRKKRQLLERKFRELRGKYDEKYVPTDKSLYVNSDWASEKMLYQQQRTADLKRYYTLLEYVSTEKMNTESQSLKNQPVIQIVQDAYLPDWKTRPKRAVWALAGFAASFVLTLFFVIYQGIRTGGIANSGDTLRKLEQIKASLRK